MFIYFCGVSLKIVDVGRKFIRNVDRNNRYCIVEKFFLFLFSVYILMGL